MTATEQRSVGLALPKKSGSRIGSRGAKAASSTGERPSGRSVRPVKSGSGVTPGGTPRVDLLPVEVHTDRRGRAVARRMWLGVVLVVAVVALGTSAATLESLRTRSDLEAAQAETSTILQEEQQYVDVRTIESDSALAEAGRRVGGSTEIDWQAYLSQVQQLLPTGVSITGLNISSASPLQSFEQASTPLQGERVATIDIAVSSTTLPSVPDWTERLSKLTGYVDSNINSITLGTAAGGAASSSTGSESAGLYQAAITLHVDEKAYDGKYDEKSK